MKKGLIRSFVVSWILFIFVYIIGGAIYFYNDEKQEINNELYYVEVPSVINEKDNEEVISAVDETIIEENIVEEKNNKQVIEVKQEVKKDVVNSNKQEEVIIPQEVIAPVEVDYTQKLNNQLNKLPQNVINAFNNSGWLIDVTDEDLSNLYFGGKYSFVQGVTDYNNKKILIAKGDRYINSSVVHEMGHFIDYYTGFESNSDEFIDIYNEEVELFKSNINNPGCVNNEMEFFAEEIYYLYNDSSKCTPKALEYIKNIINNI